MQVLVKLPCRFLVLLLILIPYISHATVLCNYESIKTKDIMQCAQLSYEKTDVILNEQYRALSTEMSVENMAMLKVVQRHWIAFKESHCKLDDDKADLGAEAKIDRLACLARQTAMRVNELVYVRTGVESDGFAQSIHLLRGMDPSVDFQKVEKLLLKNFESREKNWELYASSHCQFVSELLKDEQRRCMARMRFQMLFE